MVNEILVADCENKKNMHFERSLLLSQSKLNNLQIAAIIIIVAAVSGLVALIMAGASA